MFDTRNEDTRNQPNQKPDEYTYRDPHLSMWQSAANFVATNISPALQRLKDQNPARIARVLMAPVHAVNRAADAAIRQRQDFAAAAPDFGPLGTVGDCARLAAELLWAEIKGDKPTVERLQNELKFSVCDVLGWAECVEKYIEYKASFGPNPYRKGMNIERSMSDPVKIAIVGDWGTGEAPAVNLLQQVKAMNPGILIHLGDIYYAGTDSEITHNFLQICRATFGPNFPIYSLCGNHDMYCGGAPYYRLLDTIGQQSSYFCLQGKFWQIVAVDTGNNDQNPFTVGSSMTTLNASEIPWVLDKIKNPGGRRTILLSHHQLFSPFGSVGSSGGSDYCFNPNLYQIFKGVLSNVELWFWGHEHTLAFYFPYMGLSRGRCVGCSAIPVFTDQQSYTPDPDLTTFNGTLPTWEPSVQLGNNGTDYNHAFALLTLTGSTADVEYFEVPVGVAAANSLGSEHIP